jgi:RpiR family murPQ operon transcriptional repressor
MGRENTMDNEPKIKLMTRLKAGNNDFSPSEARIAKEIIKLPAQISTYSSQAFAAKCDVSQSSIVKFCQKLGYKGYPALKLALSAELARGERHEQVHRNIFSDDTMDAVAKKLFQSKVSALSDTLRLNNSDAFEQAVTQLLTANRIIIFGVGGSALVADDLAVKLTKFGKSVIFGGDSHIQLANLASFGPDDLLITISYTGLAQEINIAIDHANQQQVPVLAILGYRSKSFDLNNGVQLNCIADENLVRSSSIATRTAQLMITDLLYVLFTQRLDKVTQSIANSQNIVKELH